MIDVIELYSQGMNVFIGDHIDQSKQIQISSGGIYLSDPITKKGPLFNSETTLANLNRVWGISKDVKIPYGMVDHAMLDGELVYADSLMYSVPMINTMAYGDVSVFLFAEYPNIEETVEKILAVGTKLQKV